MSYNSKSISQLVTQLSGPGRMPLVIPSLLLTHRIRFQPLNLMAGFTLPPWGTPAGNRLVSVPLAMCVGEWWSVRDSWPVTGRQPAHHSASGSLGTEYTRLQPIVRILKTDKKKTTHKQWITIQRPACDDFCNMWKKLGNINEALSELWDYLWRHCTLCCMSLLK